MAKTFTYDFGDDYESAEIEYEVEDEQAIGLCFDKIVNDYIPKNVWENMSQEQKDGVYALLRGIIEDYEIGEEIVEHYENDLYDDFKSDAWDDYKDRR